MKPRLALLLWWISAAAAPAGPAATKAPVAQTLRWRNGETLAGEMVDASAVELTWKSPLFEEPLLLDWEALDRIDAPAAAAAVPADSFAFTLRDGSHLYGDLAAVADGTISIHSSRHGDVALERSEVLDMRRIKGVGLIFAGPSGDAGWKEVSPGKRQFAGSTAPPAVPSLVAGAGGVLVMPYWNRSGFLPLELPQQVEVAFHVRSSHRPDFSLTLDAEPKGDLRVETWGDELVLVDVDEFRAIRKIAESERAIGLRVCWDRQARHCAVFSPEGELLLDWDGLGNTAGGRSGLTLQNKGRDLSLDLLRVRAWDGQPPPRADLSQPRIELADGRVLSGQVGSGSAGGIELIGRPDLTELITGVPPAAGSFPLDALDEIVFSTEPPKSGPAQPALSFADATVLMGRICAVRDGRATLETSFTAAPLTTTLEEIRRIVNRAPDTGSAAAEPALAALDKMAAGQTALHGRLVCAGDDRPRWLPVGGLKPALPARALACEITRAIAPGTRFPDTPALFYTRGDDVLPGRLKAVDRSGAEFESSVVEATQLPAANLAAVQFVGAQPQAGVQSFSDPGWRILKGTDATVQRSDGALKMAPDTALGHPAAMQCRELQFTFDSTGYSVVRLRMFCDGTDPGRSANLMLVHLGARLSSGLETQDGQLENQVQTRIPDAAVKVRLVVDEKQVELHLNGVLAQTFPIGPGSRAGNGLIIEPASVWGNSVNAISLSGFSASSAPGQVRLANVNPEAKTQALTVPRFRQDDPPKNVLLAANGDVLRGEIEAATAGAFAFRSGLETLRVPRDRVEAAIWLQKPDAALPAPDEASAVLKLLDQRIEQRVRYSSTGLSSLIGFLRQQAPDLKISLPAKSDSRRFPMQFGGQTIGGALDKICALFGLSYRVDGTGTVILEPGVRAPKDLVRKVYWLRAEAFPGPASAREVLAAKGITFPEGAAALWQPGAGQLSLTDSAANQEKFAQLLETDFGGSLGSPDYWLVLASGARLGLAVDKFGPDFILGHHPVYGRCKVPVSEVCVLRNSPPEPTAAMKSLEGWRLVLAPEPVLPAAGGESSPLLGQAARAFKIPLLDGGDFDLSEEKGRVVVLDFWATWCGPCIQSLPGLIEAMAAFPADQVRLIGVDQSEPADQVKRFLQTRGWKLTVAMDAGQNVGRQYGVDGIPHTVVIGPDGKVAWVKTGYSPGAETDAAEAVRKVLAAAAAPADLPKKEPALAAVRPE